MGNTQDVVEVDNRNRNIGDNYRFSERNNHIWIVFVGHEEIQAKAFIKEIGRQDLTYTVFNHISFIPTYSNTSLPDLIILKTNHCLSKIKESEVASLDKLSENTQCPIVLISSTDDFNTRLFAAKKGIEHFYSDSIDITFIIKCINNAIENNVRSHKILVVSTVYYNAYNLSNIIKKKGFDCYCLVNIDLLTESIKNFKPDIILVESDSSHEYVHYLAKIVRQQYAWNHIPILYITDQLTREENNALLVNGYDGILVNPISDDDLVKSLRQKANQLNLIKSAANKDSLTGLYTQGIIKEIAKNTVIQAIRHKTNACFVMLDIDNFKNVNDTYGHSMGDKVLSELALLLKKQLRQTDFIGRYGGDEFLIVLPDCDRKSIFDIFDSIRMLFSSHQFVVGDVHFHCTLSIGICCSAKHPEQNGDQLIELADKALYSAKKRGKNITVQAT